jgi:hypothetical protein
MKISPKSLEFPRRKLLGDSLSKKLIDLTWE